MIPPLTVRYARAFAVALTISALYTSTALAAPALSSRPGAAYTVYLDFDGFNYTGQWYTGTPGNTAAYNNTAQVREIWARTAEKYAAFNVNVTTVDPAIAAGRATSDADRQSYYDQTARVMHTVVGNGNWIGGGGISFVGVTSSSYPGTNSGTSNGYHTNWVFPNRLGGSNKIISEASAHENGHGFGLNHQNDVSTPSDQDYSSNNGASGNGSYAPIMGDSYTAQRGTWSVGTINKSAAQTQNDVAVIMQNSGMTMLDDGVGHSFASATALPLTGTSVDSRVAGGVIAPLASSGYNPLGIDNYTKDYFKFSVGATGSVTLTVNNGGDWLTAGVVDPGMTLRSKLNIFSTGNLLTPLFVGTENAATTAVTFAGTLAAGDYYAQITSFGGYQSSFDTQRKYFDMGSYVLSGSGFSASVVPEPTTLGLLALGLFGAVVKLRRRK